MAYAFYNGYFSSGSSGGSENYLKSLIERNITEIEIPSGVEAIGAYAFYNCASLTRIAAQGGVTSIGAYAFAGCSACLSYDFSATTAVPTLDATAFEGINDEAVIYVPGTLYREWIRTDVWKDFEGRIEAVGEIPALTPSEGLDITYDSATASYTVNGRGTCSDSILVIPGTYDDGTNGEAAVSKVAARAFESDATVVELVFPSTLVTLGSYAFKGCKQLVRVENCYAGGANDGSFAFWTCSNLAHVHFIGNGEISSFMFANNAAVATYDFTDCTEVVIVPDTLYNYLSTGTGTQYLVPAALYDEWCAATNWSEYSHLIVAV
ncbi:MAG: leucine-rich repeat protein [Clostridia bacterium]|nr:leucine-rich repeat protein [Clostridia bacterium]